MGRKRTEGRGGGEGLEGTAVGDFMKRTREIDKGIGEAKGVVRAM